MDEGAKDGGHLGTRQASMGWGGAGEVDRDELSAFSLSSFVYVFIGACLPSRTLIESPSSLSNSPCVTGSPSVLLCCSPP